MLGLRTVATAIAVIVLAVRLPAQSAMTVRDTSALGRLPVSITPVGLAMLVDVRPVAPEWTRVQATPTPASRPLATWSYGDGSHAMAAAMMIVGGGGLLVGTVVSGKQGTAFMIGSGLFGLVGFWRYAK